MTRKDYKPGTTKYDKVDSLERGKKFARERENIVAKSKMYKPFKSSLMSPIMTAYNDDQFFIQLQHRIAVEAGNGLTSFELLLSAAFEQGYPAGNLKDVDATQKANWIDYVRLWVHIIYEMRAQRAYRMLITGVTEDSATGSAAGVPTLWSQSDLDIFAASLLRYNVPEYAINFVNAMCPFMMIQMSEPYEKFGINIPECYINVWTSDQTLAEMQAIRSTMQGLIANSRLHMDKFSIPYRVLTDSDLQPPELLKDPFSNEDFLAWLNHSPIRVYDNGGSGHVTLYPKGDLTDSTTAWTDHIFWTKDGYVKTKYHRLLPVFYGYEATHNKYGGMVVILACAAVEANLSSSKIKRDGDTPAQASIAECLHLIGNMDALLYGSATFGLTLDGTNFTAITSCFRDGISYHPFRLGGGYKYGKSVSQKQGQEWLELYAVEMLRSKELV